MQSTWQAHLTKELRSRPEGMSPKTAFKQAAASWHRMHGRVTKSNPGGIDLGKIAIYGGGIYLIDRLLLGGQIWNSVTGMFSPKSP